MTRIRLVATSVAICAVSAALVASAATAKRERPHSSWSAGTPIALHFFSVSVYWRIGDANGTPLAPNTPPAAGDRLSLAGNDYAGNHENHAGEPTASDHVVCTLTSASSALCDGTIAIDGSMIFADDWVLNLNSTTAYRVTITGGTGRFLHAAGNVVVRQLPDGNADLEINLSSH